MSCIFDGFYENILIMSRRTLEEPNAKELPRLKGISHYEAGIPGIIFSYYQCVHIVH